MRLLDKIQKTIKLDGWSKFVGKLKANCHPMHPDHITIKKFLAILNSLSLTIHKEEIDDLIECFNLKEEGIPNEINIKPIFDFGKTKAINKVYKTIDLEQREDEEALKQINQRLMPLSEEELLKILSKQPHTKDLWREVRKYDIDSNGFLTLNELNSVFTQVYPDLEGKSLFKVFRPFGSIQNKNLIDYKKFREYLEQQLAAYLTPKDLGKIDSNTLSRNNELKESHTFAKANLPLSPREITSPSMRRMEQIKEDILRAAEGSPINQANKHLAQRHEDIQSPIILSKKKTLEALVSPRASKHKLPKLNQEVLGGSKSKLIKGGNRALSPDNMSVATKFSQYSTFSTPFFNSTNIAIKQKLAYEWKNIYRTLNSIDLTSSGFVTKKEFVDALQKHNVFLTRDEVSKLLKKYSKDGDINYLRISTELGLHKSSYDYMRSSQKYLKNSSILKSIHNGFNDTKSQYAGMLKGALTDRSRQGIA